MTTSLNERLRNARRSASGVRQRLAGGRKARSAERRAAILAAALDEFSARGFEATRLDDVAKRANVAKGTIYLYFRDKESLFQELIRAMLTKEPRLPELPYGAAWSMAVPRPRPPTLLVTITV